LILIITEKPSVSRYFAEALKCKYNNNYYISDKYIIYNCFGHLYNLYEPHDYNIKYKIWNINDLPIIPEQFKYKIITSFKNHVNLFKNLLNKYSFNEIIIATDAGREGELIARELIYNNINKSILKSISIKRFWTSDTLTVNNINKNILQMKDFSYYDKYYQEALYRQYADYIIGINITRLITLCNKNYSNSKCLFNFGRLQMCLVYIICKRNLEISNFTPKKYYCIELILKDNIKAYLYYENKSIFYDYEMANKLFNSIKNLDRIKIIDNKIEKNNIIPNKLFNLTNLQKYCNKLLNWQSSFTLNIAQSLYEKNIISYPRTDNMYLYESDINVFIESLYKLYNIYNNIIPEYKLNISNVNINNKNIFNNSIESDHSAIYIQNIPNFDILNNNEKILFYIILNNMFCSILNNEIKINYKYICKFDNNELFDKISIIFNTSINNDTSFSKYNILFYKYLLDKFNIKYITNNSNTKLNESDDDKDDEDDNNVENNTYNISTNYFNKTNILFNINDYIKIESINIINSFTKAPKHFTESRLLSFMQNPFSFSISKNIDFESNNIDIKNVSLGTSATRSIIIDNILNNKYIFKKNKLLYPTDKAMIIYNNILTKYNFIEKYCEPIHTAEMEYLLKNNPKKYFENIKLFINNFISLKNEINISY